MAEGAGTGEAAEQAPLLVVGVGSSAGGIAALSEFVSGLVPGARICYVLAQHMGSHTASHLAAILADHTQLPVQEAEDGMLLQPDIVVLAPPGTDVKVAGNRIHFGQVDHAGGPRGPASTASWSPWHAPGAADQWRCCSREPGPTGAGGPKPWQPWAAG